MSLRVGDRSRVVPLVFATGTVVASGVTQVRLVIRTPQGASYQRNLAPTLVATAEVRGNWTLAADGSDLPSAGEYQAGAWLYAGSALVCEMTPRRFRVESRLVPLPV